MSKESTKLRNELDKLSGLIVGKNVLQSPLDFWGRYDAWRAAVKGLEKAIRAKAAAPAGEERHEQERT